MSDINYLAPPRANYINPEHTIPLSPPIRPPFSHYHSSSTLPNTPQTPYPPAPPPAASSPTQYQTPLRPYLGLPARILLVTLSPALLPLILTIAHLIQNRSSTASLAGSLKASLLSACSGLATGAAALTIMPRYLAMQTNEQAVRATQASILAVGTMLVDCVTIIEVVVTFIVDTYRSMLLCTIELAVRGTLEILIGAIQTISDNITSTMNSLRTGIQSDISSANSVIQTAVDKINSLTSKININISVPEFTIPSLSGLENVTIPTGFEDSLLKLNRTLPTLSELKEKMNEIIEKPFELLKDEMNQTRLEIAASFNSSILPVPSLSQLSASKKDDLNNDLCSSLDTSLIDDTAKALHKLSNVAIGLMFLLLFLVWAALVIWEWRRWKALNDTVETIEEEWKREGNRDAWRAVAITENPVLEKYGSPVLRRMTRSIRTRNNVRWYLSYLAHPTCLALLFIALLGFLSIQFQLVALEAIKDHVRENANATVTQNTNDLTSKLNDMALSSSQEYATDFNAAIDQYQKRIDDELFGSWLNTTAVTLNSTLVEFYAGIEDVLNTTFGGTILYDPINTFLYCILGSKIDNLEKGLTWISEHAKVTLPKLPDDVLLLSNSSMNEIAQPISAAAVGSGSGDGSDDDDGVVGSLISHFESALTVERTFYAILLGIWLAFALFGLIVVIWHSGGSERYEAFREKRGWKKGYGTNGTGGLGGLGVGLSKVWPWSKEHPIYDQHTENEKQFRGTSPIPRIVEPGRDQDTSSFFNYGTRSYSRNGSPSPSSYSHSSPFMPRKGTFGSIASLAAPGQAFLRIAGIGRTDEGEMNLTDGATSEKYTSYHDNGLSGMRNQHQQVGREREEMDDRSGVETPPPFWVDRFYRAVDSAKALFPTRGQRHGAALARNGSTRTDQSFGASQVPTPISAPPQWVQQQHDYNDAPSQATIRGGDGWTMVHPLGMMDENIGTALDGVGINDSRYPNMSRSALTVDPIYPRRLSRAPTLGDGAVVQSSGSGSRGPSDRNIFDDPPPLPAKHDSVDYLYDDEDSTNPSDDHYGHAHGHVDGMREVVSPVSSTSTSYGYHDARVESANRVETGTAALAAILANMDNKRREANPHTAQRSRDPFATPFDDERERGGRI